MKFVAREPGFGRRRGQRVGWAAVGAFASWQRLRATGSRSAGLDGSKAWETAVSSRKKKRLLREEQPLGRTREGSI